MQAPIATTATTTANADDLSNSGPTFQAQPVYPVQTIPAHVYPMQAPYPQVTYAQAPINADATAPAYGQPVVIGQPVGYGLAALAAGDHHNFHQIHTAILPQGTPRRANVIALAYAILGLFSSYISHWGAAPSLLITVASGIYVCNCCTNAGNKRHVLRAIVVLHAIGSMLLFALVVWYLVIIGSIGDESSVQIDGQELDSRTVLGLLAFFAAFWAGLMLSSIGGAYFCIRVHNQLGRTR